jgi:uncharacterized protein (DUF305 family)
MPFKLLAVLAALYALLAPASYAQSVVQPGAPGQPSKSVSATQAAAPQRPPSKADVEFMQGMIMHHGQAVEMTRLLKVQGASPALLELGKRIEISQTDEMGFMKRWLRDRGLPLTAPMDMPGMSAADMAKMDMSDMMAPMPGMLTKAQMAALRQAHGKQFDHLFLTGMIQHHTGALTMVKALFDTPGAAQDPWLFDFTSDVDNTQTAEIDIMRNMIAKENK